MVSVSAAPIASPAARPAVSATPTSPPGAAASGALPSPVGPTNPLARGGHALQVQVSGLPPSLSVDVDDGTQSSALLGSHTFAFTRPAAAGTLYHLAITRQPGSYACSMARSSTTVPSQPGVPATLDVACHALKLAYSLSTGGLLQSWAVQDDGSLSLLSGDAGQTVTNANALALTPSNQFLYVASMDTIVVFRTEIDGTLDKLSSVPLQAGSNAVALAIAPSGNKLYVACLGDYEVLEYGIDPSNGALGPPRAVSTLTPDGKLPPTGTPASQVHDARLHARPSALLVDANHSLLYVADSDGRLEAFAMRGGADRNSATFLPNQVDTPIQADDLPLRAQAQPFGRAPAVVMACDDGCAHLLVADPNSLSLVAFATPAPGTGAGWSSRPVYSFPLLQPTALAFDARTDSLYVAMHTGSVGALLQFHDSTDDSNRAPRLAPLLNPHTQPLSQSELSSIVVSRDGESVYAVDPVAGAIRQFHARQRDSSKDLSDADARNAPPSALLGTLTPLSPPSVSTVASPLAIVFQH